MQKNKEVSKVKWL